MILIDAISRQIPGFIDKKVTLKEESFSSLKIENCIEYPQYTRPAEYRELKVPEVLLSGNHQEIAAWRQKVREEKTKKQRPDLIEEEFRS